MADGEPSFSLRKSLYRLAASHFDRQDVCYGDLVVREAFAGGGLKESSFQNHKLPTLHPHVMIECRVVKDVYGEYGASFLLTYRVSSLLQATIRPYIYRKGVLILSN